MLSIKGLQFNHMKYAWNDGKRRGTADICMIARAMLQKRRKFFPSPLVRRDTIRYNVSNPAREKQEKEKEI